MLLSYCNLKGNGCKTKIAMSSEINSEFGTPSHYSSLAYHPMLNNIVLSNIFLYLNVEDLKTCRRVCQLWKEQARSSIQKKSKCKLWANCYEAPEDTNSINSFFLNFYGETEVDYIPTKTFHIINPGDDNAKRFIQIFGENMNSLILDFHGSILRSARRAIGLEEESRNLTEENLIKRQIRALLSFAQLKNLEELRIEHARDHFDDLNIVNWVESQNSIKDSEVLSLKCVKTLTLGGRYSANVYEDIFRVCTNVKNVHIMSNDLENVPSNIFKHLKAEWKSEIETLKFTKCSVSLETLNEQNLQNLSFIEFNECEVIDVEGLKLLHKLFLSFGNLMHVGVNNTYSGDTRWSITLKQPNRTRQ